MYSYSYLYKKVQKSVLQNASSKAWNTLDANTKILYQPSKYEVMKHYVKWIQNSHEIYMYIENGKLVLAYEKYP